MHKKKSKADTASATPRTRGRRKRTLNMQIRVVPPGTLQSNPRNEFARLTPEQRRALVRRTLARAVASALQKLSDTKDPSPLDCEVPPS